MIRLPAPCVLDTWALDIRNMRTKVDGSNVSEKYFVNNGIIRLKKHWRLLLRTIRACMA